MGVFWGFFISFFFFLIIIIFIFTKIREGWTSAFQFPTCLPWIFLLLFLIHAKASPWSCNRVHDGKSKGEGKWHNFDYALKCSGLEMKYEIPPTSPASLEGNYDCLKDVRPVESNKALIVYFQGRQQSAFNQFLITTRKLLTLLKIIRKQKRKISSNCFYPGNWDFMEGKNKDTSRFTEKKLT